MTLNHQSLAEALLPLAHEAGAAIMAVYATPFATRSKDDRSPVTDADDAAEVIILAGLHLMGGSLNLLAVHFPGSQLRLGGLFGETGFGPVSRTITAALEGALFAGCIVAAMLLARRRA